MTATFNELSGGACCEDSCCWKANYEGCAAGVPYMQVTLVAATTTTIKWLNLNTGDLVSTKPDGFVTGSCAAVTPNDKVCYAFGTDVYQRYSVNGVVTIFKNGTLLTSSTDIDAANAVIAGATYTNIVSCEPAKVEPDTSVCYQKTVAVPGSDTFAIQSGFTTKRILDGSGTLQERVYNMTYVTGAEADAQYSLRDGSNNRTGSPGSWAIAMNPPLSATPGVPYIVYSQKLLGTPGTTYSAGYWARERSANPAANFRVDVKNGATVIATGTSGSMSTSYTNYRSGTFVMPASGEVTFELYQTVQGNAAGNDPLLDDIGLWTTVAASTSTTTYRKSTLNGVDTYYDENGNVVTGAALTTLLADIAAGVYDVVSCATCGCDPADFISTDPDQALVIGEDGKIYYKEKAAADNATCYSKTVTSPPTQGTAQSPANNTILVPSNTQVTSVWNCTADQMGTAGGTGGFNAPYAAYNGTTPMVINDDNGMTCSTNARLDQGDILAATFQGYNGVVYGVACGMRKLSADGLGAASVRIDIRKPDGTIITNVASRSSTRQGGGGGWDSFGYYTGGGTFTADQTGTYTMLITGTSAAPARLNFPEAKVVSASGEVLTSTPGTTTTTTYRKVTLNGVDTYYDATGAVVTGAALTALLAAIAAGEYAVVACSAGCECDPADFLSTDAGQSLIIGTDGKIYNASTVLWDDDQVLTGDNTGNTTVTLTPTVITDPDNPGVSQTNYTVKVDVKVDGSTLVTNPTTGVISAVIPQIRMETETFTATAGQTAFPLSRTPLGDVDFNRNGVSLADSAATEGATVIYVPANNNAQPMLAGDRVDINYIYAA